MTALLQGPFLTRTEAAERAGIEAQSLARRPDLLRIKGPWTEETYYAFQFGTSGLRRDVGEVVLNLRTESDDLGIADWLARPHEDLSGLTPLARLNTPDGKAHVILAAAHRGPLPSRATAVVAGPPTPPVADSRTQRPSKTRPRLRSHRPLVHG